MMNFPFEQFKNDLKRDEGFRSHVYLDSEGYPTIGYGRHVGPQIPEEMRDQLNKILPQTLAGITKEEADYLLTNDICTTLGEIVDNFDWFADLDRVRQRALANMAFNLGLPGLRTFTNMLGALKAGDYTKAHKEALNSLWAGQVGQRAVRIAKMLRDGEDPRQET